MHLNSLILNKDLKNKKYGKAILHSLYVPKKDRELMKCGKYQFKL